jgi:hypothetical protein
VAVFCFFFARNHVFGQHSSLWQNLKIGIGATYATNRASATPTYLRHEAPFGALENAQGGAKGSLIKSENEKKLFWFPEIVFSFYSSKRFLCVLRSKMCTFAQ